jgi:peptidoglycan biosynthesis protein MviN/MurJ (putative lipid II flippase)
VFAAARRPWVVFRFAWIFLALNAVLTLAFVWLVGATGAAVAIVVANYAAAGVYVVALRQELGLSLRRSLPLLEWARHFVVSGACALPLLAIPASWPVASRLAAGALLYGGLVFWTVVRRPGSDPQVAPVPGGAIGDCQQTLPS